MELWQSVARDALPHFPELALTATQIQRVLASVQGKAASFPDDFLGRCLLPDAWAAEPPNAIVSQRRFPRPPEPTRFEGQPRQMRWLTDYAFKQYDVASSVVESPGARVGCFKWLYPDGRSDEWALAFTRENATFFADMTYVPYCDYIQAFEPVSGNAIFSFGGSSVVEVSGSGRFFFIGGRENYLHWLADHLALALFDECQDVVKNATLVCNDVTEWQQRVLAFFGLNNPILRLQAPLPKPVFYRFPSLTVPTGFPVPERFAALRRRFAQIHGEPEAHGGRIYLSRAKLRPRHRVANEEEVAALFERRGFRVLYPETMPLAVVARLCANASIVANAPGSSHGNFFVFSPPNAVLISLTSGLFLGDVDYVQAAAGAVLLVPFLDRIVSVYGAPAGLPNPTGLPLDMAENFDLGELDRAVDEAEALQARL